jgi:polysaccharide biosynthesis transport protein
VSLRHYLDVLWRRKWIVVQAIVIIPAIVVAVSLTRPTQYTSTARIMADTQSPALSVASSAKLDLSPPDQRELATLASFVVTPEIARMARTQLGWNDRPATLMSGTSAAADPNANVITVTSTRADPQQAADLANAFATQFVAWRKQAQQTSLNDTISLVSQQITAATDPADKATLQTQRSQLEVLKSLLTGGLAVGEAASPSHTPSSPKPLRDGILAVAAGLIVGIGLAFVRESLDVRLHSADDVAALTDIPVIAAIPEFRRRQRGNGSLTALDDPRGPTAEAYRFLRTNLEFLNFNRDLKTVLITSPEPGQGKSTTITNLAVALLRAGRRVAVVEGDLRRPSLHRLFAVTNARGVTSAVSGAVPLADALQTLVLKDKTMSAPAAQAAPPPQDFGGVALKERTETATTNGDLRLTLLPAGPLPPNPGEIVSSRQLAEILEALKRATDYVLIDAPPMFAVGDAAAMGAMVDGIIVVTRLSETTAQTIRAVEDFFSRVRTKPVGIVVTGVPRSGKSRYRYDARVDD